MIHHLYTTHISAMDLPESCLLKGNNWKGEIPLASFKIVYFYFLHEKLRQKQVHQITLINIIIILKYILSNHYCHDHQYSGRRFM